MKKRHALVGGLCCMVGISICVLFSQGIPTVNADTPVITSAVTETAVSPTVVSVEPVFQPEPATPVFEEYDVSLMAVGDNLMHMGIPVFPDLILLPRWGMPLPMPALMWYCTQPTMLLTRIKPA